MNRIHLLVVVATLIISGCFQEEPLHDQIIEAQTFRSAIYDPVQTLDPVQVTDPDEIAISGAIHETLYEYRYLTNGFKIVPLLAADYPTLSKNRRELLIPIKHKVYFHGLKKDGKKRELTAQDFVYSLKRMAIPTIQSPYWNLFAGKIRGLNRWRYHTSRAKKAQILRLLEKEIDGIKAVDSHHLLIKLTRPLPRFLQLLTLPATAPIPHEVYQKESDENLKWDSATVGTGPFKLKEWLKGRQITLEANRDYHPVFYPSIAKEKVRDQGLTLDAGRVLPLLEKVEIYVANDASAAWTHFKEGRYDHLSIPTAEIASAIASAGKLSPELLAKKVMLHHERDPVLYSLGFSLKDKKLGKNKLLRQAISASLDRERWIQIATNGLGIKAQNLIPFQIPGRVDESSIRRYDFNIKLAKKLVQASGVLNRKKPFNLTLDMDRSDTLNREIAQFIKTSLAEIGIEVQIIYNESLNIFFDKIKRGAYQLAYVGHRFDVPQPEVIYRTLLGENLRYFRKRELQEWLKRTESFPEGDARSTLLTNIEKSLGEELPLALGFYSGRYVVTQPWLKNYYKTPFRTWSFKHYRIEGRDSGGSLPAGSATEDRNQESH